MKIAQRILAQARRDVEALELASARLHNPPTLLSLVTEPRSAYDLGERFVTVAPAEPSRLPGATFEAYNDDHAERLLDESDPDPRWETNREVRFAVKSVESFADDVATQATGMPAVIVDPPVAPEWDARVYSWRRVWVRCPAAFWAYLQATAITTRKIPVFRYIVDRANAQVITQKRGPWALPVGLHSIGYAPGEPSEPVKPWKTTWREGFSTTQEALDEADYQAHWVRLACDGHTHIVSLPGRERRLIIIDQNTVIYRPDRKGVKELGRKTYQSRDEALLKAAEIREWTMLRGIAVRVWSKKVKTA